LNSAVATTHGKKRLTVRLSICVAFLKFPLPERRRPKCFNSEPIIVAFDHRNEMAIAIKSDARRARARNVQRVVRRLFS